MVKVQLDGVQTAITSHALYVTFTPVIDVTVTPQLRTVLG